MTAVINTNMSAVTAERHLTVNSELFSRTVERLASGVRINHASDDAAGLAISAKFEAQVRGTAQAGRNVQSAVSLIQVADGAMTEVLNDLQRWRELAVQGANSFMTTNDQFALQVEMGQLGAEVDAVASQTTFNTRTILAAAFGATFQVGPDCGQTLLATVITFALSSAALSIGTLPAANGLANQFTAAINSVDIGIALLSTTLSNLGGFGSRLDSIERRLGVTNENLQAAQSRVMDADIAEETTALAKLNVIQAAGVAMLAQANNLPVGLLRLLQ
jgi:flagellin